MLDPKFRRSRMSGLWQKLVNWLQKLMRKKFLLQNSEIAGSFLLPNQDICSSVRWNWLELSFRSWGMVTPEKPALAPMAMAAKHEAEHAKAYEKS
jgi:hypothetical protein